MYMEVERVQVHLVMNSSSKADAPGSTPWPLPSSSRSTTPTSSSMVASSVSLISCSNTFSSSVYKVQNLNDMKKTKSEINLKSTCTTIYVHMNKYCRSKFAYSINFYFYHKSVTSRIVTDYNIYMYIHVAVPGYPTIYLLQQRVP